MSLISVSDLNYDDKLSIFDRANWLMERYPKGGSHLLKDKIVSLLFLQPSTRTRLGFASAVSRLGATTVDVADINVTRSGDHTNETMEDFLSVAADYSDCIVIRHFNEISSLLRGLNIPVISGGLASFEHPTQAISDLWTLLREGVVLSDISFGLVGYAGTRVFRSLIKCLVEFGVTRFNFVSPKDLHFSDGQLIERVEQLPHDIGAFLNANAIECGFFETSEHLVRNCDVVEVHPLQVPDLTTRLADLDKRNFKTPRHLVVTGRLVEQANKRCFLLHPGPRGDELHVDTDSLENSLFFKQVQNSLYIRQAVLLHEMPL
ncbi:hypothetical protein G6L08_22600 [Agrobacterium rhizogenes]|nr:hypothetical protein [Rhizobium rhizogenes]